jgi:hypothetical protein
MMEGSGNDGSGFRRSKNIRIRIHNTDLVLYYNYGYSCILPVLMYYSTTSASTVRYFFNWGWIRNSSFSLSSSVIKIQIQVHGSEDSIWSLKGNDKIGKYDIYLSKSSSACSPWRAVCFPWSLEVLHESLKIAFLFIYILF